MSLIDDLIRDEGMRLTPYKDTEGHLTIGIGINLDAGITEDDARHMCQSRISALITKIAAIFPWFYSMGTTRQDALVNMAYNLGIGGLMQFHNMLHALATQDWETAATEALASKWAEQTGDRAKRIAAVFRGGIGQAQNPLVSRAPSGEVNG